MFTVVFRAVSSALAHKRLTAVTIDYYCNTVLSTTVLSVDTCVFIGASLSEPHTNVTALRTRVCMLVCLFVWTDHLP